MSDSRKIRRALLRHEREIAELLSRSAELEHEIATWFEPCLELRRRELSELTGKLNEAEGLRQEAAGEAPDPAESPASPPGAVAVIVRCRDLGRGVPEAVSRLFAQTVRPAEVVVADDGSTDLATRHVLARLGERGHRVVAVPEPCPSPAAAWNLGVRSTRSPIVAFFDADAVAEPSCLEDAAALFEDSPKLGFVSLESPRSPAGALSQSPPAILAGTGRRRAAMVRREAWVMLDGFDERLAVYPGTDFRIRAVEKGFTGAGLAGLAGHPLRPDSAGHGALDPATHLRGMEHLYEKHAPLLDRYGDEVLCAREGFLRRERRRFRRLSEAREKIESELEQIAAEAETVRSRLRESGREPIGWGDLRRTTPLSHYWGLDRGQPVDRVYVEAFLDRHRADVHGHVLEIRDAGYTMTYSDGQVTESDVLDVDPGNPEATIVADLSRADSVAGETFDCFILTQTLNVIYDVRGALWHAWRILKPGGVLLLTVSSLNRVTYGPGGRDADFWRFTEASLRELFAELAPLETFEITPYGNVLSCVAFLYGITAGELAGDELSETDPYFPLIYGVRLVKPGR